MLNIGITGGIGSGKSTICKFFSVLGIPVYNADLAARILMNQKESIRKALKDQFGEMLYQEGMLNRKYLALKIFNDPDLLSFVNRIVHPEVRKDYLAWASSQKIVPYALQEAAILFESGADQDLDATIMVSAPEALRIDRIMRRDNLSLPEIHKRIASQMPEEEKMKRSRFVILNDDAHPVIPQILEIDRILRLESKN